MSAYNKINNDVSCDLTRFMIIEEARIVLNKILIIKDFY